MIHSADLGGNNGALMLRFVIYPPQVRRAFINTPGTSARPLADDNDHHDGVLLDFQRCRGP